jgi:hypothetical protein
LSLITLREIWVLQNKWERENRENNHQSRLNKIDEKYRNMRFNQWRQSKKPQSLTNRSWSYQYCAWRNIAKETVIIEIASEVPGTSRRRYQFGARIYRSLVTECISCSYNYFSIFERQRCSVISNTMVNNSSGIMTRKMVSGNASWAVIAERRDKAACRRYLSRKRVPSRYWYYDSGDGCNYQN